jgi:hypothetical protein
MGYGEVGPCWVQPLGDGVPALRVLCFPRGSEGGVLSFRPVDLPLFVNFLSKWTPVGGPAANEAEATRQAKEAIARRAEDDDD